MASTIEAKYGGNNTAITCTVTSLANNAYRQSTAIDNSSNLYLDALVTINVKSTTTASATGYVAVYAYGTTDGGTTYDGGASGSDSAYTPDETPPNLPLIGIITLNASSTSVQRCFSVAAAFGGQLPQKWGIIVANFSNTTLNSSVGSCNYQGIQAQTV